MLREQDNAGIRIYEANCIAAAGLLFLLLVQRGVGGWALIPLGIGIAGLAARGRWSGKPLVLWRTAPFLMVLAMAVLLIRQALLEPYHRGAVLADLLLVLSVLGYVVGHYRLQGLDTSPLPAGVTPWPSQREGSAGEIMALLVECVVFAGAALVIWDALPDHWNDLGIGVEVWRTLLLIWLIGLGVLLTASLLLYLHRLRLSAGEAELLLQDVLWRETRGEQRRVARWQAWRRRKDGG